jgi:hypothetical protein
MAVSLPGDYCYHCHQQTLTDRPSHRDFAFDSCASAGCHNYHDNSALYESFLLKHAGEPDFKKPAVRPVPSLRAYLETTRPRSILPALARSEADAPEHATTNILESWSTTSHAFAGVNCNDCHLIQAGSDEAKMWHDQPGVEGCAKCHRDESAGFLAGHHGMRLAQNLDPLTPAMARLPMKEASAHRSLTCASCHGAHEFDTRAAAVDACLSCHDDSHSRAFLDSPHFQLWRDEMDGEGAAGSGVSCATCHLPRETERDGDVVRVLVQHNQNNNLRPNEKMIRSVCHDCHGLGFAIDALADSALVANNFNGRPRAHIESIDLALRRQLEKQKPTTEPNPEPSP